MDYLAFPTGSQQCLLAVARKVPGHAQHARVTSCLRARRTPCSWIQLKEQQLAGDAAVHERDSALWFEANRLIRRGGSGQDGGLPATELLLQGVAHFLI